MWTPLYSRVGTNVARRYVWKFIYISIPSNWIHPAIVLSSVSQVLYMRGNVVGECSRNSPAKLLGEVSVYLWANNLNLFLYGSHIFHDSRLCPDNGQVPLWNQFIALRPLTCSSLEAPYPISLCHGRCFMTSRQKYSWSRVEIMTSFSCKSTEVFKYLIPPVTISQAD